jgi:hypothetical protein
MTSQRGGSRRVRTWVERAALGAIMGAVAFVVERRLRRALRGRDEDAAAALPGRDVELSATPKDVDQ